MSRVVAYASLSALVMAAVLVAGKLVWLGYHWQ